MVQVVKGFVLSFYFIKMLYIHMFINTNLSMSRHSLCIVPPGPAQHQQSQRHDRPTVAATVAQAKDRLSSVTSLGQNRLILCLSLSLSLSLSLGLLLSLSLFPSIYIYIYICLYVTYVMYIYLHKFAHIYIYIVFYCKYIYICIYVYIFHLCFLYSYIYV